jgi:uncharacterized membrane protein
MITTDIDLFRKNSKIDIQFAAERALSLLGIKFTPTYLKQKLEHHPNFPSLLSLSDLLEHYKVSTTAGEFENKEELLNYNSPHIALTAFAKNSNAFNIIHKIEEDTVYFQNPTPMKKIMEIPLGDHLSKWAGIALFFEKNLTSSEPNYLQNQFFSFLEKSKWVILLGMLLICLTLFTFSIQSFLNYHFFVGSSILKLIGVAVFSLMIYYTFNYDNPYVKGVCTLSEKTDCNYILNSKAAKVFDFLSWSEVGFLYFSVSFILTLLAEATHQIEYYNLTWILTLLCLPYTIYSVYYQLLVAKKICILCMSVQAILWLEFSNSWVFLNHSTTISLNIILIFLLLGGLVSTIWFSSRPLINAYYKLPGLQREINKFKLNAGLFNSLLTNSKSLTYPLEASLVTFGNKMADFNITIFTNPLCGPCGNAHHKLENLLSEYGDNLSVTEVFTISNNPKDNRRILAANMIQLYKQNNLDDVLKDFHRWYSDDKKDIEGWLKSISYIGDAENENYELLNNYANITQALEINSTPTIAINGKQLPDAYALDDLIELMPYLI